MKPKSIASVLVSLVFLILFSSFATVPHVQKFTPVGHWEYSVPGVPEGYETGTMIISEEGKQLKVSMMLNEYYSVNAENVIYEKKDLSFTVWVENEEVKVAGSFDGDSFSAKLSYFEGDFTLTAKRKPAE